MNSEVLKHDLFERVVDGVKVFDIWEQNILDIEYTSQTYNTKRVGLKVCIDRNERFKPILFSNSCLTKPIQIKEENNGKPFVPIKILAKVLKERNPIQWFSNPTEEDELSVYEFSILQYDINENIPLWMLDLLKKWHINFRLNSDEFIEVTDSFNPYI